MTLHNSSRPALTPGRMLASRSIPRGVMPGEHGPGWAALSDHYTEVACEALDSLSLSVVVAPGAAGGEIGRFIPSAGRLDIEGALLGKSPEDMNILSCDDDFAAFGALHGVFLHELGHAAHSRWYFPDIPVELLKTMAILEEARMEGRVVEASPAKAKWLRLAASSILLDDGGLPEFSGGLEGVAQFAALTIGRVYAGSLAASDVAEVSDMLSTHLSPVQLSLLDGLIAESVEVADGDVEALGRIAARWNVAFCPEVSPKVKALARGDKTAVVSEAAARAAGSKSDPKDAAKGASKDSSDAGAPGADPKEPASGEATGSAAAGDAALPPSTLSRFRPPPALSGACTSGLVLTGTEATPAAKVCHCNWPFWTVTTFRRSPSLTKSKNFSCSPLSLTVIGWAPNG